MPEIGLLKMGHILCLVYWLGVDLGVFYSSYFVSDDRLSDETRVSMAKLLFALDQGPRLCMPLMLATGVHLGFRYGQLDVTGSLVAATWAVCAGWLTMVLTLHVRGGKALTAFDYGFRIVMILGLGGYAVYALTADVMADWLALKLLIFAGLVACGLFIRRRLRPFGPAFAALAGGNATADDNAAIRASLGGTRPYVVAIWFGLLLNTALGVHLL